MDTVSLQVLHRVREPICKTEKRGAFIIHFFSTLEKAQEYAKGRGYKGKDAEILAAKSFRVVCGYVISGEIDKEQ